MKTKKEEPKWGGARDGAGRPPLAGEASKPGNVSFESEHWRWLKREGNASAAARALAEDLRRQPDALEHARGFQAEPKEAVEQHSISVPPRDWELFKNLGEGYRSAGIRRAILEAMRGSLA